MINTRASLLRIIITGASGMVGEGVLHECLQHNSVGEVLVVGRTPCGVTHPKLKEVIHKNFFDLTAIEGQLGGYDACLFCLGVTSVGKKQAEYFDLTYTLTITFAEALVKENNGMVFCYVSGASTDSSEKGRVMWARVKGQTENELLRMPFKKAYMFRPGYMHPTRGLQHTHKFYSYIKWMYPIVKALAPNKVSTLAQVGQAMIQVLLHGYEKPVLEISDINKLAGKV